MATFRNRHGKWQAHVQRKGQQPVSKSFQSKQDAEKWARQLESEMDNRPWGITAICSINSLKPRRPPSGYTQLDLTNPEQLALAILKTLPSK